MPNIDFNQLWQLFLVNVFPLIVAFAIATHDYLLLAADGAACARGQSLHAENVNVSLNNGRQTLQGVLRRSVEFYCVHSSDFCFVSRNYVSLDTLDMGCGFIQRCLWFRLPTTYQRLHDWLLLSFLKIHLDVGEKGRNPWR